MTPAQLTRVCRKMALAVILNSENYSAKDLADAWNWIRANGAAS